MFRRVWALSHLVSLGQVLPFHKELKQLDVEVERHVEEELLSSKQLLVKARGETMGSHTRTQSVPIPP